MLINDACVILKKPFIHAGVTDMKGQILTWMPGRGPCLRCLSAVSPAAARPASPPGVLGASVGVISCMQALEAIKILLGTGKTLTGRMLHFDGLEMTWTETAADHSSPYCRVCGKAPSITDPALCPEEYLDFSADHEV